MMIMLDAYARRQWSAVDAACTFAHMFRFGQNRIYAPYMTVYLVISLPKTP